MRDATAGTRWQGLGVAALLLVILALHFVGLGVTPLLEPDEGRYLEIPREMLSSGDWVTPRLNGVLYFEKPPLYYWLNAGAVQLLGLTETAARVWNALFGVGGMVLVFVLGSSLGGRTTGLLAAAMCGTSPYWVGLARLNSIDMTLTFFVTASLVACWLAQASEASWRARLLWWGAFSAAALAVLAKGLVGLLIPAAVVGLWMVATRRWDVLRQVPWLTGGAVFLLIAAPWHILASARNPSFAWFYFVHEHVLRYATAVADRHEPWWFFAAVIGGGCAPWSGLFAGSLALLPWRGLWRRLPEQEGVVFLWCWAGFVMLFFSISQSKLIPYVLPAVPAFCVLGALAAANAVAQGREVPSPVRTGAVAGSLLAGLLGGALVWIGLGNLDKLDLGGRSWPGLLALGGLVVVAAAAVAVASWRSRWQAALAGSGALALLLTTAVLGLVPRVGHARGSKALATALEPLLRDGDLVLSYRDFHEGLPVYLQRLTGMVGNPGELSFGVSHLSGAERRQRFPTVEELREVWSSSQRIWLACNANGPGKLAADGLVPFHLVWSSGNRVLVTNHPPAE